MIIEVPFPAPATGTYLLNIDNMLHAEPMNSAPETTTTVIMNVEGYVLKVGLPYADFKQLIAYAQGGLWGHDSLISIGG